ncbi:tRNA 2-thiouridine(34) synthase MnmA [Acidicapsa ligni]|uniref:tRNA 2-thiouridine(34) synthase MnmA n=1 Tax=Acidicapsa ligni TaxID=542300 RepID=UPI0021DF9CB5|nr:tRNA 2-thiouridine(34) synthase MnmA [Acidicapsa ligni]
MPVTSVNTTIAVAMSGGVDSSTVAAMLRAEGAEVIGLTLQLWDQNRLAGKAGVPTRSTGRCCSLDDVYDARRVAETLDIPYYVVNQQERFEQDVVKPFVNEYLAGRTPIPCSLCNNHLKFDQLLRTARQIGADRIATGHYARNEYDPIRDRWILKRPSDLAKDQTWFLGGLTQEQLAHTLFPLGHLQKPEVREIARQSHLALADKPDSQEICFIPGGDYKQFITNYLEEQGQQVPDSAGDLVTATGERLGAHEGIHNFTIGQRKGLGVTSPNPLYVLQIDSASHRVTVGEESELNSKSFRVKDLNWISIPDLTEPIRVQAKIRHRHDPAWAWLQPDGEGFALATFDEPQRAVTPGQCAVFYDGDEVVGGAWIHETFS